MIYSHTLLTKFELCPRQWHAQYVTKTLPREAPTQALKDGRDTHEALEHRLGEKTPLPEPLKDLEPYCLSMDGHKPLIELSLAINQRGESSGFWDDTTWWRGKLDLALPTSNAVILDWKTGKRREDPDELEGFALLLKANFPLVKHVNGYYIWLKEMKIGQLHELSDTDKKFRELKTRTERVEKALAAQFFPPLESWACGFCPLVECQFNKRRP